MPVVGLDHVNILAADLEASVRFYSEVLGLDRRPPPGAVQPGRGAWLCDETGQAVVHLTAGSGPASEHDQAGGSSGAVRHIAFACRDYEAMAARLSRLGIAHRAIAPAGVGFRQIFLTDLNDVTLELNFSD